MDSLVYSCRGIRRLVGVNLTAPEYMVPFDLSHGRIYDAEAWLAALLTQHSQAEFLAVLAVLNHVATEKELLDNSMERVLSRLNPSLAEFVGHAMTSNETGPRVFLSRQVILRTMRLVLTHALPLQELITRRSATGTPWQPTWDLEVTAVLLCHAVSAGLSTTRRPDEGRLGGLPESLAMEIIQNSLFYELDEGGTLLGRYRLLWGKYGRKQQVPLRKPPLDLLEEATGLSLDDILTLAFTYYSAVGEYKAGGVVRFHSSQGLRIAPTVVDKFLDLFSASAVDLADAFGNQAEPWQMLPFQERPLLREGEYLVVLDEGYLLERVTRGLYWLVHDHEIARQGEAARHK